MSGSTALLLTSVAPDMVRSTDGDRSQRQPGRSSPARLSRQQTERQIRARRYRPRPQSGWLRRPSRRSAARPVSASSRAGWKRMLGREPVRGGQGA